MAVGRTGAGKGKGGVRPKAKVRLGVVKSGPLPVQLRQSRDSYNGRLIMYFLWNTYKFVLKHKYRDGGLNP